jgi:hypothetical protein
MRFKPITPVLDPLRSAAPNLWRGLVAGLPDPPSRPFYGRVPNAPEALGASVVTTVGRGYSVPDLAARIVYPASPVWTGEEFSFLAVVRSPITVTGWRPWVAAESYNAAKGWLLYSDETAASLTLMVGQTSYSVATGVAIGDVMVAAVSYKGGSWVVRTGRGAGGATETVVSHTVTPDETRTLILGARHFNDGSSADRDPCRGQIMAFALSERSWPLNELRQITAAPFAMWREPPRLWDGWEAPEVAVSGFHPAWARGSNAYIGVGI